MNAKPSALILGAGIMGLCSAWALNRAGWQVRVVEQAPIPNPRGASVDQHRLIRHANGFEELYDLALDPHEFTNRANDPALAEVKARLTRALPAKAAASVGIPAGSPLNLRKTPGQKAKAGR